MNFIKNIKEFISYFNTPFLRPKIKFYFGKVAIGTPYFTPRRAVKDPTNPDRLKFADKKIGFDFCRLGWKTKWSQYRFEWAPIISFVFFKWQIAMIISAPEQDHYWESWLYYQYDTNKNKSIEDRVKQCKTDYPQNWKITKDGVSTTINYYDKILKKKYRRTLDEIRQKKIDSILK
jgi:hypothetical protein